MAGAELARSLASTEWDKIWSPRIETFAEALGRWFTEFEDGGIILYTSDGDPNTIAVPDPLPGWLDGTLDPDLIAASGKTLVRYDPATGESAGGMADAPPG